MLDRLQGCHRGLLLPVLCLSIVLATSTGAAAAREVLQEPTVDLATATPEVVQQHLERSHTHTMNHCRASKQGFYQRETDNVFLTAAKHAGTDKVTTHSYHHIYAKYFETMPKRCHVHKLLEIGLGCTMEYGAGHSAHLWRSYLPHADVWFAEYDKACVDANMEKLKDIGVKVVTGDQSDTAVLHQWIKESGGEFDVIIDDGGHTSMQQYNSFIVLFEHALKPGGIYFLEDIAISRTWLDGDRQHVTVEVIKDWIEQLVMDDNTNRYEMEKDATYNPKFGLPPNLRSIDCIAGMCALTKCFTDDALCRTWGTDDSLLTYEAAGTGVQAEGRRRRRR